MIAFTKIKAGSMLINARLEIKAYLIKFSVCLFEG
jgi:hypothetical protein